ncbi:amidohydrolase [Patescibacteria group bacterium]|nr:amidohydrolase [Patescibacteria group bacterium]
MKKETYEKPTITAVEHDNVRKYLFPFSEKEKEELKEIIEQLPETIIDFHSHIGPIESVKESAKTEEWGDVFNHHEMESLFRHNAILSGALTRSPARKVQKVVFAIPHSNVDYKKVDDYIRKNLKESADGFIPFLIVNNFNAETIKETAENLRSGFYRGLKAYPTTSKEKAQSLIGENELLPEKILQIADERELPIVMHLPRHLYNHLDELKKLSADYPNTKFVLAHMGLARLATPNSRKALAEVLALPNVYCETSTVTDPKVFEFALAHDGADKLIFGSDAPFDAMRIETKFEQGKMKFATSEDLPELEKSQKQLDRWLLGSLKALLTAIHNIYPDDEEAKTVIEKIFYSNGFEVLERFRELEIERLRD